jgi:DNA-binding transcriptional LysR family regulator
VTGGDLAFGATLITVDSVLREVVPLLRQQCPGLRLDIKVGQAHALREMLEQERIELFIGYANELAQEPAFELTPLPAQFGSIYCRSGHPLARPGGHPSPAQLLDHPWAAVIASEAMAVRMRRWLALPADARLPVSITCDSLGLLREVVLSDDTLLATWPSWLQPDLESGKLVDLGPLLRPAMPHDLLTLDCAIVRLAGRTASPAAEHLIRLVQVTVERGQPA